MYTARSFVCSVKAQKTEQQDVKNKNKQQRGKKKNKNKQQKGKAFWLLRKLRKSWVEAEAFVNGLWPHNWSTLPKTKTGKYYNDVKTILHLIGSAA